MPNQTNIRRLVSASALTLIAASACSQSTNETEPVTTAANTVPMPHQAELFGPMYELAGTRWYAEPKHGGNDGVGDVQHWYWEFGGRVLAQRHALEDGSYGGITYITPADNPGELDFIYITSGGFHTTGVFNLNADGSWTSLEAVEGHDTITQVRSIGQIDARGTLKTKSEYFDSGEWVPGLNFEASKTDRLVPEIPAVSPN